jgi:hypothetical protein
MDDEIDDDDDSECDDEETQLQRLHCLKSVRDEERKRREQESQDQQALALSVEQFAIPEVLFRPTDIGMDCGGIAETIVTTSKIVYRYRNLLSIIHPRSPRSAIDIV